MSSLNASMSMALQSLLAEQAALDVTTNNISNSNTPGYTREVVNLSEAKPIPEASINYGAGVTVDGIQSVRDQLLQLRINDQTQQTSNSQTQTNALQQLESYFSNADQGIGADMNSFFNSLSQLSTNPSSTTLRQSVLSTAGNLVNSFNAAATNLNQQRQSLDQTVPDNVLAVNHLTQQIANLASQISAAKQSGQDAGGLEDQRAQLVIRLSQLVDVQTIPTEGADTLTLSDGTALVVGSQAVPLSTSTGTDGMQHVYSQGKDVTASLQGGSIGGTLQVRDTILPSILGQVNTLAIQFATAINTANATGTDLNGAQGAAVFNITNPADAAGSIQLALTDPSQIAASSDGTSGSGGNLTNLLAVKTTALPSGATPLDTYSNIIFSVGNASANAQSTNTADNAVLSQLQQQLSSVSGVSLDEETTNMIRFQRAYQASARVISTVDQMFQSLIGIQ